MQKNYKNDAAIWINKDKNGKSYISFKAERDIKEGESINLFKNDKGDNPKRPDYRAYTVEEAEQDVQPTSEDVADSIPF